MYVVVEFLEATPAGGPQLRAILLMLARAARERTSGCRQFDVAEDEIDARSFLSYQIFDDKAAYLAHLELPEYADHRRLADPLISTRRILTYELISPAGVA